MPRSQRAPHEAPCGSWATTEGIRIELRWNDAIFVRVTVESETLAKVVVSKSVGKKYGDTRLKDTGVTKKRVVDADGKRREMRTLDTGSKTFTLDLTYVFGKNVEAARRENKRLVGVSDIAPRKR
jgi:hypothetical protein